MTDRRLAVVVLAAGKGTRMRSDLPKVLHRVAGKSLLAHVLDALAPLAAARTVVVVGPGMESVNAAAAPHPTVVQEERLGTGHALLCAKPALRDLIAPDCDVLVVFGDTPLVTPATFEALAEATAGAGGRRGPRPKLVLLGFHAADPTGYGRIVTDGRGTPLRIVEHKDANREERRIDLCNGGLMLGQSDVLFDLLVQVGNDNAKGEYYLTDLAEMFRAAGHPTAAVEVPEEEIMGINARAELAAAEAVMQRRLRERAMEGGATLVDPATVWLTADTRLGRDVVIQPNVVFGPGVRVGDGAEIRSFSHLEGVDVGPDAVVGPFARLRPGAVLGRGSRIGNFVEVKNAVLEEGAKANHLTYIGDATVGSKANVGAGTITCNYDGFGKHRTNIGKGAFIGSNTALVAPVSIGDRAIVAAGSTVTKDVPGDALVIERAEEKVYDRAAEHFRAKRARDKARETESEGG